MMAHIAKYRNFITRIYFSIIFIFLLWRHYSHLLPHQFLEPVFSRTNYDILTILYNLLGGQVILINHTIGAHFFSIGLFVLCLVIMLKPGNGLATLTFSLLFLLYNLVYTAHLTHPVHFTSGLVLMNFVFIAKKEDTFKFLWEAMRYYACWTFASAFIWKIINGAFFQWDFGEAAFKSNVAWIIFQNPDSWYIPIYEIFLKNPILLNFGDKLIFLLEGLFCVGFFTKKWDNWLLVLWIFIHGITLFFVDTFFIEMWLVAMVFISPRLWQKFRNSFEQNVFQIQKLKRGTKGI